LYRFELEKVPVRVSDVFHFTPLRSDEFEISKETFKCEWKFNFQRTFNGNKFINDALVKQNASHRPTKWMVCMFESEFMPIIQSSNEKDISIEDIQHMSSSVGLLSPPNDDNFVTVLESPIKGVFKTSIASPCKRAFCDSTQYRKNVQCLRFKSGYPKVYKKGKFQDCR
jgi:hypothetical protein